MPDALAPAEEFGAFALAAAAAYGDMNIWRQHKVSRFDFDVSADDVFEAVAHLVQLQAVWTGQGESAAKHFFNFVLTSPAGHLMPLQVLWTALQKSSQTNGIRRATELLTWMLIGPWEQLKSNGHPASRFFQVLEMCLQAPDNDAFVGQMSSAQLFDVLDELTGSRAWMNNLASAAASADRRINHYAGASETLKGGYWDALFAVATVWHHDQSSIRETFLKTPELLTYPLQYVSLERRLPPPFFEIRFGSRIHERNDRLDSPDHRAITVDAEGKKVHSFIVKPPSQSSESLDNVLSARLVTHMVDFLFTDEPVLDLYEHWCRSQILALVGKELISVY